MGKPEMFYILCLITICVAQQHTPIKQSKLDQIEQTNSTDDYELGRTQSKRLKKLIQAKTFQMRRFAEFEDMFRNEINNHTLLLRFYAYGCYCLNLGDRPMAGIMTGMEPADMLDESCFHWTKCNRCVVFDYGTMCSPEITHYSWDYDAKGEIQCLDEFVSPPEQGAHKWNDGSGYGPGEVPGCRRALCECDKEQIYALKYGNLLTKVWNIKYHQFFGGFLFDDCKPKPKAKGSANMNCCGLYPTRSPFDMNSKICCDGYITEENRCVGSSFNKKRKRRAISMSQMIRDEKNEPTEKVKGTKAWNHDMQPVLEVLDTCVGNSCDIVDYEV